MNIKTYYYSTLKIDLGEKARLYKDFRQVISAIAYSSRLYEDIHQEFQEMVVR